MFLTPDKVGLLQFWDCDNTELHRRSSLLRLGNKGKFAHRAPSMANHSRTRFTALNRQELYEVPEWHRPHCRVLVRPPYVSIQSSTTQADPCGVHS
ncbi:hypothetical protein P171DRAFT_437061 [Karstenula rhodostoma CBS 690.94]|uniref:Uncharacterized protein n=1 Tax=Karstenula rhodostoma CBS 690.94 TaxID=1392251 RepID=A0A9P4P594_9PLEO|nr:hypothetical protein P171DRAFT_437061 [Karstenula rhodostoma CBS 690.94]